MLKNSQTKVIMPVITFALLVAHKESGQIEFADKHIEKLYDDAVKWLTGYLGHDLHIGARYYDAYGSRMSRYKVLQGTGHLSYQLQEPYVGAADDLLGWIPEAIKSHISTRLGVVPSLGNPQTRLDFASRPEEFVALIDEQIGKNPANFEIFSFAVMKVHLEHFACHLYRDTRTSAHDKGVDLSTNFGVVYQVKKLRLHTQAEARVVLSELKSNFDPDRLRHGNVILVIDDISKDIRQFLIDVKVQSISKKDLLKLAANFDEPEDRQKVLRIAYEEFRREYSSTIP